ncbi:MAG: hypothetical protein GX458_21520, partial [Phyllobacteriaceae bacterium]|nr:hypothetical protein [Phyllobacteriaceae bacterium]
MTRDPGVLRSPRETCSIEETFRASFDPALLAGLPGLRKAVGVDPMDFPSSLGCSPNAWVPHGGAGRCAIAVADLGAGVLTGARMPPSHFDVTAGGDQVFVVFGMDERHHSVVNGVSVPFAALGLGWPGTRCVAHWPEHVGADQSFVTAHLSLDRVPPDWPRAGELFSIHELSGPAMTRLRTVLTEIFLAMAREAPPSGPDASEHRLGRLVEAIGLALRGSSVLPAPPALVTKGYLSLIDRIDDHIVAHFAEPIRLEDVAEALRVSRRTIHNVMTRVRGQT